MKPQETPDSTINERLSRLTTRDKVKLLTGSGPWKLYPMEHIGLRPIVVSDGPAGVRGVSDTAEETAASFPSPSALAATWDVELVDRVGHLFAAEARRHNVDVILAPVVNLHRTPVGGRHFECFSEDPLLTSVTAATLIASIQRHGVGACIKHFVANESETARTEYVAKIDERTLRELYLKPFEDAVKLARVWTIMAAYNGLDDGIESNTSTEHRRLITDILKTEWGFDGLVVSDWTAARSTVASANAGLDLVMPGTGGPWEDKLLAAVDAGTVSIDTIDDKVGRILRLADRVGALGTPAEPVDHIDAPMLLREFAARSMVMVKNDDHLLPQTVKPKHVALIGPNAVDAFFQGGGSAHVNPDHVVTPVQGLREALDDDCQLTVHRGGYSRPQPPEALAGTLFTPQGQPGMLAQYLDCHDTVIAERVVTSQNVWLRGLPIEAVSVRVRTQVLVTEPGKHWLGVSTVGAFSTYIDGQHAAESNRIAGMEVIIDSSVNNPPSHGLDIEVETERSMEIDTRLQVIEADGWGRFARLVVRHIPPGQSIDEEIAEAVEAAAVADLAVVVVGTNNEVESEGWDRPNLSLPGRQDELVSRVAAVNPRTIVVVNAGAPVLLPWLSDIAAVVWSWFPGQECGHALADVIFGHVEPSGRLPWTLPAVHDDVPVPHAIPTDGVVEYREEIHIGYRAYERDGVIPAAPFGHGLGWTSWDYHDVTVEIDKDEDVLLEVTIRNIGDREGTEIVQVYLSAPDDEIERPTTWLAGFTATTVAAGASTTVPVRIAKRCFAVWDTQIQDWRVPTGEYRLRIGRSVSDIRLFTAVSV